MNTVIEQHPIDILLASMNFYPVYSGAAIRFQRYAPGLKARGIRMCVFAGTSTSSFQADRLPLAQPRDGTLLRLDDSGGLPIQRVQLSCRQIWRRHLVYGRTLVNYSQKCEHRYNLIHSLSASLWSIPALLRLRSLDTPLILSHTVQSKVSSRLWKSKLQRLYWRIPFQLADCIVTSTGLMRDHLRDIGVTTPVELIPNGVDLNRFCPIAMPDTRATLRQKLGLDPTAEVILFVGPLIPRKGVDVLIEAWCLLAQKRPKAYLVLVGPNAQETPQSITETNFEAKIRTLVAGSHAEERVIFTGPVENVEVYLQVADVFAFPSHREGMPNVVPEAFSCGTASILTPFLGLPTEFGQSGRHYLLVDRNPEALATAITHLLEHPEYRRYLGSQARQWVEDHIDLEKSLDQYAALYREFSSNGHQNKRHGGQKIR